MPLHLPKNSSVALDIVVCKIECNKRELDIRYQGKSARDMD